MIPDNSYRMSVVEMQPEEAISESATSEIADSLIACNAVQFHFDEEVLMTNLLGNEKRSTQTRCLFRPDPS